MNLSTSVAAMLHLALGAAFAQEYRASTLVSGVPPIGPVPALEVSVGHVAGVATDRSGNVYFSSYNNCVFKLDPQGGLWRVAGNCQSGYSGDGGAATVAELDLPKGLAVDSTGNLYIADYLDCRVRKVTSDGIISTIAGTDMCRPAGANGGATSASLSYPNGVAVDAAGDVFIEESDGVRELVSGGKLTPIGVGPTSSSGIALDASGSVYIAVDSQIFKIASGQMTTFAGKPNSFGDSGDGGPALNATFGLIIGLAIDSAGDVIVADGTIRSISTDGTVHTVANNACCAASLYMAWTGNSGALAVDALGNIYVGILLGDVLRKISPQGEITDVAGTDNPTYVGDGGPAIDAQLSTPEAVAVDASGNVYIADFGNSRVRKISPSGVITTVAGNGISGFSGDGGPAIKAQLAGPVGLATDSAGNLFIAEYLNDRVRKVTPDGNITTVAGSDHCCDYGDGGLATDAFVPLPHGIALDPVGNLYISEWPDSRIRKVTPSGVISTYAGTGTSGFSGDGGPAAEAQLSLPWGLAVDGAGNLFLADIGNLRVRKIAPDGIITTIAGGPSAPQYVGHGVAADLAGKVFISSGWMISRSGTPSPIIARSGNGQVSAVAIGIAVDVSGSLFLVNGNKVLELEPIRPRRGIRR